MAALGGWDPALARLMGAAVIGAAMLWYCLSDRAFRNTRAYWLTGIAVGVLVVLGWTVTGIAGADEFEPAPPRLASASSVRSATACSI